MTLSKQDESFNFLLHKSFNISEIINHVNFFTDEWLKETKRQEKYYVHRDTNSYIINEHSLEWKIGEKYSPVFKCNDEKLWELINPIIKEFEKIHNGKMGMAILTKLPAGKIIDAHNDSGEYLAIVRRHHVPIITNPDVTVSVGEETIHMNVGECWEINNNHLHSVANTGATDRVHLIFDIMPNEYFL